MAVGTAKVISTSTESTDEMAGKTINSLSALRTEALAFTRAQLLEMRWNMFVLLVVRGERGGLRRTIRPRPPGIRRKQGGVRRA